VQLEHAHRTEHADEHRQDLVVGRQQVALVAVRIQEARHAEALVVQTLPQAARLAGMRGKDDLARQSIDVASARGLQGASRFPGALLRML